MASKITLLGTEYTPAGDAARAFGFSRKRITQFCRASQVDAKRMGNAWFVNKASLSAFLAKREEDKARWREQLSA